MHKYGSLSLTALLGRWKNDRTAKIYIDGAAAEWATWQLGVPAEQKLERCSKLYTKYFASWACSLRGCLREQVVHLSGAVSSFLLSPHIIIYRCLQAPASWHSEGRALGASKVGHKWAVRRSTVVDQRSCSCRAVSILPQLWEAADQEGLLPKRLMRQEGECAKKANAKKAFKHYLRCSCTWGRSKRASQSILGEAVSSGKMGFSWKVEMCGIYIYIYIYI